MAVYVLKPKDLAHRAWNFYQPYEAVVVQADSTSEARTIAHDELEQRGKRIRANELGEGDAPGDYPDKSPWKEYDATQCEPCNEPLVLIADSIVEH